MNLTKIWGVPVCLALTLFITNPGKTFATDSRQIQQQATTVGEKTKVSSPIEDPSKVQQGDLVEINYTISLEDGKLVDTNIPEVAEDPSRAKADWYEAPKAFAAEKIVAGEKTALAGLGEAIVGMAVREKRRVVLPPEKAYGEPDPKKVQQAPCAKNMPRIHRLSPEEYVKNFASFPVVGKVVWMNPYFPARIVEVTEKEAVLEFEYQQGQAVQSELGEVSVQLDENNVTLTLNPKIGTRFGNGGRITSSDGKHFTVDFNNPAAGKTVVLDLEVVSLIKASAFKDVELTWLEDHDRAVKEAARVKKPVVLLLYADWCPWCQRLMNESFKDPRVKILKDRFVWAKVNSEKEVKYKQMYGQNGYPMIVFLDAKGQVLKKDNSFLNGSALGSELDSILKQAG